MSLWLNSVRPILDPVLQHDQRPQAAWRCSRVRCDARRADRTRVARRGGLASEVVPGKEAVDFVAQSAVDPAGDRDAQAAFATIDHVLRQPAFGGFFQDPFRFDGRSPPDAAPRPLDGRGGDSRRLVFDTRPLASGSRNHRATIFRWSLASLRPPATVRDAIRRRNRGFARAYAFAQFSIQYCKHDQRPERLGVVRASAAVRG